MRLTSACSRLASQAAWWRKPTGRARQTSLPCRVVVALGTPPQPGARVGEAWPTPITCAATPLDSTTRSACGSNRHVLDGEYVARIVALSVQQARCHAPDLLDVQLPECTFAEAGCRV